MEEFKPPTITETVFNCINQLIIPYMAIGEDTVFFKKESPLGRLIYEAYDIGDGFIQKVNDSQFFCMGILLCELIPN